VPFTTATAAQRIVIAANDKNIGGPRSRACSVSTSNTFQQKNQVSLEVSLLSATLQSQVAAREAFEASTRLSINKKINSSKYKCTSLSGIPKQQQQQMKQQPERRVMARRVPR